jgi:hypothetical protein
MPKDPTRKEILAWEWYDSRTLGAATVEVSDMFQNQNDEAGEPVLYYTNIKTQPFVPSGEVFRCDSIAFTPQPDITSLLLAALLKGVFQLWASDRVVLEVPLRYIPGSSGFAGYTEKSGAAQPDYPANGVPLASNRYVLNPAIEFQGGETVKAVLRWPVAPTALFFYVSLKGVRVRSGA